MYSNDVELFMILWNWSICGKLSIERQFIECTRIINQAHEYYIDISPDR